MSSVYMPVDWNNDDIVISDVLVDMDQTNGDILVYYINDGYVVDADMDEVTGDITLTIQG